MFGFIKNWFRPKTTKETKKKYNKLCSTPKDMTNTYFRALEYNRNFNIDYFCNELGKSEEFIAEVHKLIKERLTMERLKQIEGDF